MSKKHTKLFSDDRSVEAKQKNSSAYRAFDNSEESKHIAELLAIAGAENISPAVRLQVAAMRTNKKDRLANILKKAAEQATKEESSAPRQEEVAIQAVMAAAKFRRKMEVRMADHSLLPPCYRNAPPLFVAFRTAALRQHPLHLHVCPTPRGSPCSAGRGFAWSCGQGVCILP